MNKNCARCSKVVYPIEELKCLDKAWHKTCFKCHECGMALNMKTYKGFNKLPYCEAHIPKAKATAIADTPELKRIAENTKHQSNVKYHADFEKAKGKFTQVADDPETLRIKQNTKIISNVAYHGDLEKKAAMEKQRETAEVAESRDNESEYFSETLAAEQFSQYAPQQPANTTQVYNSNNKPQQPTQQQQANQQQHIKASAQNNSHQSYAPNSIAQQSSLQQQQQQQQYHRQQAHNNQMHQQQQHHQQQIYQSPTKQPAQQATSQNYQQQQHPHNAGNYANPPNYQQPQDQSQNNYMHMRTSIVQNSHVPSGGQDAVASKYYEQYENNYARPTSNAQVNAYNNNSNASNAYQHQHHQPQQSQKHAHAYTNPPAYGSTPQHLSHNNGQISNNSGTANSIPPPSSMGNNGVVNNGVSSGVISGVGVLGTGNTSLAGIGKIADYDPLTDGPRNIPNTQRQSTTLIYSSDRGTSANNSVYPKRVGSVADIDPANGHYGSLTDANNLQQQYYQQQLQLLHQQQQNQIRQTQHQHHHHQQQQQQQSQKQQQKQALRMYRALYDYEAQDTDEVSFCEGDLIYEIESIDAGWMTGKVDRTGKTGMLPANYVEPAAI